MLSSPVRARRTALLAAAALAVPLLFVASPLAPAQAQIAGSTFEANDGNLTVNTTGNKDWVNAPNFAMGIDTATGKNDNSFAGGVDEDTVNPGVGVGSIPNSKDDLARFYLGFEKSSTDQRMLYLAWIRNKTSGSADMDFELNQSAATTSDGLPVRTPGDILVTYEFISTKTPDIRIQRWITSGSGCVAASAPPCWANRVALTAPNAEAMVNDGFVTPDPRFLTGGKPTSLPSQTFGEAAINLSSLGIFSSTGPCTRFARAFAKTRSSHSFNASMQDLIAPIQIDFSNCVTKTFDITAAAGVPSGTTLYAVYTKDGAQRSIALAPGAAGHLTGSDGSVTPGSTLTGLHLELRDAAGNVVWQGASQDETITQATTNTGAFGYGVTLSPASAENFVGRPHLLTATATATGSLNNAAPTTAPLKGIPVGFRLESGTPSGCGSLSPLSATTNAQGQAQTTLTSTTACSTTIRAFIDRAGSAAGYETGDVTGTATKTFVAYALSVSPASATNELGKPHTFTVTLTRNTGSGAVGYAGQSVGYSLADPDGTGAYVESVNGTATNSTSVTSGTCTTNASGQCTIVARAPRTGTFTLNVSYTTTNASGQGTFTGSGTKSFADYRISVTPASATNQLNVPHTFTVLLEKSTNNTWTPFSGATVALALTKTAGDAAIISINGVSGSGTSCVTRSDGTCSVVINATQPGQVTLTATYTKALDSGTVTRTASGTKQYAGYNLTVTPASATNDFATNPQHTFTVTLTRNEGSGFVGYAGQTVSLALNPGTSGATITSINGVSGSGTSCTTQSDGTCIVVVTATAPGQAVLTASWSKALSATETVSKTASGSKQYSDFSLDVTPESATNDMQHPDHTFTVTLKRNDGSGFTGYAGQTVSLSLNPGTSGATITSINGVAGSGTSCVTRSDGTCSVVIRASSPGQAVLSASWSQLLDSGTATRSDSGSKQYSDFALTVTPLTAINDLNQPHTFTVTLTRDDGAGFKPYAGQPVSLSLDPGGSSAHFTAINGAAASGTTGTCTTKADGTCAVTINSSTAGTATLTATWSEVLSSTDTASLTAQATKSYLTLNVSKTSCTQQAPAGGLVAFDIPWSTAGKQLGHATITDTLPAGLTFVPNGSTAPTSVSGQTLTYALANPLPDPSSGTVHIVTAIAPGVPLGTVLTNAGTFTADEGVSRTFSASVTVTNTGASATGQAYGLKVDLLGSNLIPPTPSVTNGSDSLLSLAVPPLAPTVLSGNVGLLNVSNAPSVTANGAEDDASAEVANLSLVVAGIPIKAKAVAARSDSIATGSFAGTSTSGSEVVDLQVGTMAPIDVSSPTVLPVVHAPGLIDVSVSVLEPTGASGAAAGVPQPAGGKFASGLTMNGLHIRATTGSTVLADVIVSQARSAASFPTLTPCAGTGPYLIGNAFVAKEDLTTPVVTVGLPVGLVTLNAAGGSVSRTINTADLSFLGVTSGTGETSTAGSLTTMRVDSDAQVQRLKLALGAATVIDAALIHAHASKNSATPSNAEIARAIIAGVDVCAALATLPLPVPTGSGGICKPNPNTVLLDLPGLLKIVLNEQMTANNVTTVNAVHVYVLGPGNALGLPVGSDLIISSATAGIGS